ncbi:hypothetical protein BGZ63DRAFT_96331 [Mariannaea sp. PMI_226]|nr:hypothetical protein BGZ63DRAFT_96331 [Mariannaea sp. PMI_226]
MRTSPFQPPAAGPPPRWIKEMRRKWAKHLPHYRLNRQCGACRLLIEPGDGITQMRRLSEGSYLKSTAKFPGLCMEQNCSICAKIREPPVFHRGCLKVWEQYNSDPDIYRNATWTSPWCNAGFLSLTPDPTKFISIIIEAWKLKTSLPQEVQDIIWDHVPSHSKSRWISAYFAQILPHLHPYSNGDDSLQVSLNLTEVAEWSRGKQPKIYQEPRLEGLMRLQTDYLGLQKIERVLPRENEHGYDRSSQKSILMPAQGLASVAVTFQNGLARLDLPLDVSLRV